MTEIRIEELTIKHIKELTQFCVPTKWKKKKVFKKGMSAKEEFLKYYLEKYDSIAKLAYKEKRLVGFIQYLPRPEEQIIEIQCIFVHQKKQQQQGIGKMLLQSLFEEMKQPKSYFNNQKPKALITFAFDAHSGYPQHAFYRKYGFKKISEEDEYYLYYPLEEGYQYKPKITEKKFQALPEDAEKTLLFINPFCPFCYSFTKLTAELVKTIEKKIEVEYYNVLTQKEEVNKRGGVVPDCVVNRKPIGAFFMEKEAFLEEVKKAMERN